MAAMSLFTVSCVEEYQYEKGEADVDGCYGVYFPVQEATGDHTYDPSMPTEMTFTVARTKAEGAITVPIEFTESHEGIFEVPAAVFADGQTETAVTVTFPTSENGVKYELHLGINDPQYASKYQDGATQVDFSVLRVEWKYFLNPQTGEPAKFTFNQGWWEETHTGYVKYYEVNGVRTCQTVTDPTDYDGEMGYGFWGTGAAEGEGELNFKWYDAVNAEGKQIVELPVNFVYYHPSYAADVNVYDWYTYFTVVNPQAALAGVDYITFVQKYGGSYITSYYDNGGFYFATAYYYMIGVGGWSTDAYEVTAEAEGFTRVDYTFGVETDYTVEGSVPVTFELGADITKVNYVVAAGTFGPAALEELTASVAAGTAENIQAITEEGMFVQDDTKYASVNVTCPATGEYTLVAVGFDNEGNAQASTSTVFDYVAADDSTYDVEFEVIVEDTPARYEAEGLTKLNSFAFTVYGGNGATEAHVAIYETATVNKDPEAVVNAVRAAESTALGEEDLAAFNSVAGYSDVVSGLKDGVSYTVVVWAANGMQTKVAFAEYVTEKNPEKFKSLGTGLYTEDFLFGLFNGLENVTYEVEIEESEDNPGKYRLVNPYGAAYPFNAEGDYDASQDYYMVIDAQDPASVYIPLQGVGCDWGYGEWEVYSLAAYYLDNGKTAEEVKAAGYFGTLADGVITFPESSLLITSSGLGGYYTGNTAGAFKVVLPGAASTALATSPVSAVRPSSFAAGSACELPKSAGYFTGIDYSDEIRTVACTVETSNVIVKKATRHSAIEKTSVSLD